jgi:hypothetical protein
MSIDDKLFKLMFDDNFHICMIYGIEIKSNQIKSHSALHKNDITSWQLDEQYVAELSLQEGCGEMSPSVTFIRLDIHVQFHIECILPTMQLLL